jgi:hypothetical protein
VRRSYILYRAIAVFIFTCSFWLSASQTEEHTDAPARSFIAYGLNIDHYEKRLLEMALKLSYADAHVSYYPVYLPRGREFTLIEKSQGIDVT